MRFAGDVAGLGRLDARSRTRHLGKTVNAYGGDAAHARVVTRHRRVAQLHLRRPRVPWISNIATGPVDNTAIYLAAEQQHLVRCSDSLRNK